MKKYTFTFIATLFFLMPVIYKIAPRFGIEIINDLLDFVFVSWSYVYTILSFPFVIVFTLIEMMTGNNLAETKVWGMDISQIGGHLIIAICYIALVFKIERRYKGP